MGRTADTIRPLEDADDRHVFGGKASALARAVRAGLPVLPGYVLPTGAADLNGDLAEVWAGLEKPLVVRSSSPVEDTAGSSQAGRFTTVLGVTTLAGLADAVRRVRKSGEPMAVLVQPQLSATVSGVLFGLDPLTGRRDRIVAVVTEGNPDAIVSGRATGTRYVLTRRGRVLERDGTLSLSWSQRRQLAGLARRAGRLFGGPQDIEWAFAGQLWLLQSRPVTASGDSAVRRSPVFGPGPVAETFPDPLAPLEEDLWLEPLRTALAESLRLSGAASRRRIRRSPVLVSVRGLAAADLGLLGVNRRSLWSRVDPRQGLRRLAASWRVGRLRVALPALAADVIARLDADLVAVPHLRGLTDDRLLALLQASRRALVALHGHEVLAGLLVPKRAASSSAAARALEMLATGRQAGLDDDAIVAATPETLALIPPRIGACPVFAPSVTPRVVAAGPAHPLAETREALRLRARWVQELSARVALELGRRLAAKGALPDAGAVRLARLRDLGAILAGDVLTLGTQLPAPPPLPAAFRLTPDGTVIAVGARSGDGTGVSAGRAAGTVRGRDDTTRGGVLVVRTLDPSLAPLLPELDGLVAETGSVLSHLAILARELRLPAVIGVAGAMERFPAGTHIRIDGATGEVRRTEEAA